MKILLLSDLHYGFNENTPKVLKKFLQLINTLAFDVVVITGDLISHKQSQMDQVCHLLRSFIDSTIPILVVKGNHDYWNSPKLELQQMFMMHGNIFKTYNITHLQGESFVRDNVIIVGFDGWYGTQFPLTNDREWMLDETFKTLMDIADFEMQRILEINKSNKKLIAVTHFGLWEDVYYSGNHKFGEFLENKADVVLYGHTHKEVIFAGTYNPNCIVYNCGSDYNLPRYKIVEV